MSEKKMVRRSVAVTFGIICVTLVVCLVGAFAYYMPVINDKNYTISSLNSQVTNLQNQITSINSTINSLSSQVAELENQVISQISHLEQYLNVTLTTTKVGKAIQIQSMYHSGTTLYVYVQNIGNAPVTLSNIYVDGILDPAATFTNNNPLAVNQTSMVTTSLPAGFNPTNAWTSRLFVATGLSWKPRS